MNSNKSPNEKKNLTPIFVGSVIGLVVVFFLALFLIQPSSDENYLGGEIDVVGESLPDLSVNFNRDCVLFDNLNYCQQLEPAAKMEAPIISGSDLNGNTMVNNSIHYHCFIRTFLQIYQIFVLFKIIKVR